MDRKQNGGQELLDFINGSPTAFHAVDNCASILTEGGFKELRENEKWEIKKGGKYFLRRNSSAVIAFEIGTDLCQDGLRIVGTHTDAPALKIKSGDAIVTEDGYVKLNTECYGGAILNTWFDRPLSIAGRVITKSTSGYAEKHINIEKPVLIIPNLCIHFNREVNNGCAIVKQVDMLPLLGFAKAGSAKSDYILDIVSADAGIAKNEILDYDLFLYESDKGRIMGPNSEFISASRLDNLWMVFTGIKALVNSAGTPSTKVFAAFDNEEVGSTTLAGANSSLLGDVIARICSVMGLSAEESLIAAANSMAVSADCVHAVHPNHGDKHDSANRPVIGKGLTLKYSAAQKYATNARTAAVFADMCKSAGVPYQKFANRSDLAGGTTIGPVISSLTSIPTVDLGIPILAMHSIREFGCLDDNETTISALSAFFVSQNM